MSRRDRSVFVGFSGLHGVIGIEKKILNNISPERFHLMQIGGRCLTRGTLSGKAWATIISNRVIGYADEAPPTFSCRI